MILVLLGTQKYKFNRLIKYINDAIEQQYIKEDIIIQCNDVTYDTLLSGKTHVKIKFVKYIEDYETKLHESSYIICHSGVGVIMDCLKYDKKVITLPRQKKYFEHIDDHQLEIANKLGKEKYLTVVYNYNEFVKALKTIDVIKFKRYKFNNDNFNEKLNELINSKFKE